jgi:sulfate adenylyltransferase
MMGIGAFRPLQGFMGIGDWQGVCEDMKMANGLFWPIPITLSVRKDVAGDLKEGHEVALVDEKKNELMGSMVVEVGDVPPIFPALFR